MKNIKPKKVRLQKVVKVKPVKQTKLPDTSVSGSNSTGRIKIKTKAPKTPSQGYVEKPKPEKSYEKNDLCRNSCIFSS